MALRTLLAVLAGVAVLVLLFAAAFKTVDPCAALRAEYQRVLDRNPIVATAMRLQGALDTDAMSPLACARAAVQLRVRGEPALSTLPRKKQR